MLGVSVAKAWKRTDYRIFGYRLMINQLAQNTEFAHCAMPHVERTRHIQEFVTYEVLKEYGRDAAEGRRQYRAYTESCVLQDDEPMLAALAASRYAIGGVAFLERTEERIESRRSGRLQDADIDLPHFLVPLAEIDAAVAQHYRIDAAALRRHGRSVGEAKVVAVELACRLAGVTGREIGAHYGGISSAAVSVTHRKVREGKHAVGQTVQMLSARLNRQRRKRKHKS